VAIFGSMSDTHLPDWPGRFQFHGDFMTVPRLPKNGVIVFAPCVSLPWCLINSGL